MRVGYACQCLGGDELRCQRTTVLKNATPEKLRGLIQSNLEGLAAILRYNEAHDWRLFRIGNDFIPFASHPINAIAWWSEYRQQLQEIGTYVRDHGHRVSFHASHYTILNSVNERVRSSALADVEYMGRVLEAMQLGPEHKIILHVGVNTPTLQDAEERFVEALMRVAPEHRRHLVLENDDRLWPAEPVAGLCRRVGLPMVVDVFHHSCLPGSWEQIGCTELLQHAFGTWGPDDGPPKIHFSTQDPAKRLGAHDYGIDPGELNRFLQQSRVVPRDFDIMFECKGKDLALEPLMDLLRHEARFDSRHEIDQQTPLSGLTVAA